MLLTKLVRYNPLKCQKDILNANHGLQMVYLTSSLTKSKLLKKKLKKPTEQNINAFKKYCIIFDKVKKMAKESYFNLELELNKNNLKKTWEILRQAIHKQNNRPTFPDTFIMNGKSNSNISEIAEEFNNFFVNI